MITWRYREMKWKWCLYSKPNGQELAETEDLSKDLSDKGASRPISSSFMQNTVALST